MTGDSVSPRNEKISVKCKSSPLHGPSFEVVDFNSTDISPSGDDKCTPNPQSSKILKTTDLISAVGYAWGYARRPLSLLLSKNNSICKSEVTPEVGIIHYSIGERTKPSSTSSGDQPCSRYYLNTKAHAKKHVEENKEPSRVKQMASCPRPSSITSSFWGVVLERSTMVEGASLGNCLLSARMPPNMESIYGWMSEIAPDKPKNQVNSNQIESKRTINCYTGYCSTNLDGGCVSSDKTSALNSLTTGFSISKPEAAAPLDLSLGNAAKFDLKPSTTTCLEKDMVRGLPIEATVCKISTSGHDGGSQEIKLASDSYGYEDSITESRDALYDEKEVQERTFVKADSSDEDMGTLAKGKPLYALAKQEHAFAGAMAGIFVSLCLHPMDTIKTVIQSCQSDQKPLHYIGRSIFAERGISGLYRGISSNIVSSAPISALYTFTYESVKRSLLPLLPKENHSLAHCTAGGCASVATSFIFTPSERIKQQMQVGSHYRNCWNALIQVVEKGGLSSLYAGWGAVLCRNVPHSVIKFYTYESLKQIMLPSIQLNTQANILVTLVCGGLAGSMASLVTTPFDVVKTRLQTQTPGSMTKYRGVLNTLREIGEREGLNGLYRGLTPRLVMYMIQGALFFASYESFKRLFSLEFQQLGAQALHHEQKNNESTVLPPTLSVTA